MEIVVRTPHGDADVTISSHTPTTTLGDIVATVTGQAKPTLVQIDDRPVDASTRFDVAELLVGSVLTTEPPTPAATSDDDIQLVQIAGHGAGRTARLGPGRYRIGPGRRSSADELGNAPVERAMFELLVEPQAPSSLVTVVPETSDVAFEGTALEASSPWHHETLTVGSRAFQLDNPARSLPTRRLPTPDADGRVPFSRSPRQRAPEPRRPLADAVHDARTAAGSLWQRRAGDDDAFVLPIGLSLDDAEVVSTDLGRLRALAITGSGHFRDGLVRALIVEAVTLHGPADVDLVVLTERPEQWDWAKWLPHLCLAGSPAIWTARRDIDPWLEQTTRRPSAMHRTKRTMVILDGPGLWTERDSLARSLVSSPPDHVDMVTLCDTPDAAPAVCTAAISETDSGLARLHVFPTTPTRDEDGDVEQIVRPALAEADVAATVARALAPLADNELPVASTDTRNDPPELNTLVGATDVDQILRRWSGTDPRPSSPVGRWQGGPVEVPVADGITVVSGPSLGDAFDVAATSLFAQCVERPPNRLWVAPLPGEHNPRSALLWALPHATEPHDPDAPIEPSRLFARLRSVLADEAGPDRIVLVVEAPTNSPPSADDSWLTALAAGVRAVDGVALTVVTDRRDLADVGADTLIRLERRGESHQLANQRCGTVTTGAMSDEEFTAFARTRSTTPSLELRPFVVGRPLTPLERRLERRHLLMANAPDPALSTIAGMLNEAGARHRSDTARAPSDASSRRTIVPLPMPTHVDLDELFAAAPGDGVPVGVVDDPIVAGVATRWWEPGSGSLLVFGSRRSGSAQVLATILLGVIDRFSDVDVRLVSVEPSAAVRRGLGGIERAIRVVAPDRPDELSEALDEIAAALDLRDRPTDEAAAHHRPKLVVLIGDLVQLRRRYADQELGARIDEVLERAALAGSGVDVIASAVELDGAGPFATAASSRLIGASSDHRELVMLGVEQPAELDGVIGRCRSFPDGELVQLAFSRADTEALLARRSTGGRP